MPDSKKIPTELTPKTSGESADQTAMKCALIIAAGVEDASISLADLCVTMQDICFILEKFAVKEQVISQIELEEHKKAGLDNGDK
jgi:hypothetical protein